MAFRNILQHHRNNVATLRASPLSEVSGALGDLGTLLPLMIALAVNKSISLSSTLIFSGLFNILTGIVFGIPLPVQPMKAIAAVGIARKFTIHEIISAGFTVSGVVFLFSITGLLRRFTQIIPIPVVKGIQVGAGLSLVLTAGSSLLKPLGWTSPSSLDNLIWGLLAFLLLLFAQKSARFPYALILFLLGILFSVFLGRSNLPSYKIWNPNIYIPSLQDFQVGAIDAGLGQIPLTTLNSIIAVTYLAADLLPHLPAPGVTEIGISVALMNLVGGWFGVMPLCHGSGGLAAQYRFGARSGASIIILGLFKLALGLFFGETLVDLLRVYPKSLLGVMVLASGLELAKVGESLNNGAADLWEISEAEVEHSGASLLRHSIKRLRQPSEEERKERWMVMLMTIGGLLAFRNDGVGFAAGVLCHVAYQITKPGNSWMTWRRTHQLSRRSPTHSDGEVGDHSPLLSI
ncbi:hypothetical protein F5884DRAFT_661400 [Xylogone sp. PMI_703]|nr:hypothetical protein F5884DRAFT_661400 [Xylogone sp. PMI_703]